MSENFVVGDVVRHINGGPKMTIEDVGQYIKKDDIERYNKLGLSVDKEKYGKVRCLWFDDTNNLHRDVFQAEFLVHSIGE